MELEESSNLILDYTTKLQQSRQHQNRNIDNGKIESPEHTPLGILALTTETGIYNGEKTAFSINGAGKFGQLHVKE